MMKEMLTRRFNNSKFKDELDLPSLLLIDGGKGQYNSAKKVLDSLKIDIPIISMAKGEERDAGREILIHDCIDERQMSRPPNIKKSTKREILSNADVISLHVPRTVDTIGLIGEKEIAMMRKDAFLINRN